MNKSNFFSGQPIFSQLLKLIPKDSVLRIAYDNKSDHYCKRFNTYEHLVTMLYSIFNNCNSIREVTTGMLASEQRLAHLGIRYHPRRSTISDANIRRQAEVFEKIYLFQEVLRTSGKNPSGKRKGGIKVHTLIRSDEDVPSMIRLTEAAANDS